MMDQFPEKFGKYKIIEEVGRGGFADVYRAIDTTLDRTVALKFLEPRLLREPTFVERFQREAKLAANLKLPISCLFTSLAGRRARFTWPWSSWKAGPSRR
ncbi:MAG: hypothetical protein ACETWR_03835 [Anaerolineae bacterium]